MPRTLTVGRRTWIFGIALASVAGLVVGLWGVSSQTFRPWVMPGAGGLLIVSGLVLVSPYAIASRPPWNARQRHARILTRWMGAASILYGAGLLVPSPFIRLPLTGLSLLLMIAAGVKGRRMRKSADA